MSPLVNRVALTKASECQQRRVGGPDVSVGRDTEMTSVARVSTPGRRSTSTLRRMRDTVAVVRFWRLDQLCKRLKCSPPMESLRV